MPFAFWLVDVLRPSVIVELGTHSGVSYSAMCQAVQSLGVATSCFAVDTWKDDEHAGFYDESVYENFQAFYDRHYNAFSRLLDRFLTRRRRNFENGTIDLFHIDGLHTYRAARHDLESGCLLSANAIVLLHDANVRESTFALHRLWRGENDHTFDLLPALPELAYFRGWLSQMSRSIDRKRLFVS